MKIGLKQWSKLNGINEATAYQMFRRGQINGAKKVGPKEIVVDIDDDAFEPLDIVVQVGSKPEELSNAQHAILVDLMYTLKKKANKWKFLNIQFKYQD